MWYWMDVIEAFLIAIVMGIGIGAGMTAVQWLLGAA